jgi:hypothetical protein
MALQLRDYLLFLSQGEQRIKFPSAVNTGAAGIADAVLSKRAVAQTYATGSLGAQDKS